MSSTSNSALCMSIVGFSVLDEGVTGNHLVLQPEGFITRVFSMRQWRGCRIECIYTPFLLVLGFISFCDWLQQYPGKWGCL